MKIGNLNSQQLSFIKMANVIKEKRDCSHINYFVTYFEKKLYVMPNDSLIKDIYMVSNLGEFEDEYRKELHWYIPTIRNRIYDHVTERYVDAIQFLPLTIANFKKEFPYAPIDDFMEVSKNERNVWYGPSTNYQIANFMGLYVYHPEIEKLYKSGFQYLVVDWTRNPKDDMFRKAFKSGKDISEITGMPNWMWRKLLNNHVSMKQWDTLRIWNKQLYYKKRENPRKKDKHMQGLDEASLNAILNQNMLNNDKTLKMAKNIITNSLDDEGRPLFTITSLFSFLERVDIYQAIPSYSAIEILSDYVRMCKQLGVTPRIDSDSLKREHDIIARNLNQMLREKEQEFENEKSVIFTERSKELSKYNYENEHYIARAPRDIKDLINEGIHNHNCVGSYVNMYAKGNANVFFIRKKETPDKSYITIQLNGPCTDYTQAYLASNQRIYNIEDWKFINEWLEHNKALNN